MNPESTTEIVTQVLSVSAEKAEDRIVDRFTHKVRSFFDDDESVRTVLRYKPYYQFDATLRKKIFRGEDVIYEGAIIVDGLTGVARPILREQIETERKQVSQSQLLQVDIEEESAYNRASRNKIKVQQREDGTIDLTETPEIVHKPVWLVEFGSGEVQVVDATNGQVFGNALL